MYKNSRVDSMEANYEFRESNRRLLRRYPIKHQVYKRIDKVVAVYSQLIMERVHVCLSSGYNLRFIGHESVSDILERKKKNKVKDV
jgi:hypothetical protein